VPVITPLKSQIRTEETQETAAVSSAVAQKIGGTVNFLSQNISQPCSWSINGKFGSITGSGVEIKDGGRPFVDNVEIVGFSASIGKAGITFDTTIEIERHTATGVSSSIFIIAPKFQPTAVDNSLMSIRFDPNETLQNPTGTVLPTFVSRNINKGDFLFFKLGSSGSGAKDISVTLHLRAR
jgi:hypothetical protein